MIYESWFENLTKNYEGGKNLHKFTKTLFCLALTASMVATSTSLCSRVDEQGEWIDPETNIKWYYSINGENATIARVDESTIPADGNLDIPATVDGYKVTAIGKWAFWECSNLKSVTVADGIELIIWGAFQKCRNLESVTIPSSVTKIDDYVFYGCEALK